MPRDRFVILHETLFWDQKKSPDPRAPPSRRKELAAVAWMMECLQTLMVTHETYQRRVASKVNHVAGDLKNCAQHPSLLVQTRAKPDDNDETVTLLRHCKFIDETMCINSSSRPHLTNTHQPVVSPTFDLLSCDKSTLRRQAEQPGRYSIPPEAEQNKGRHQINPGLSERDRASAPSRTHDAKAT